MKTWEEVKMEGSLHYKGVNGDVEPVDLYRSLGALRAFALCSIIKYAARNTGTGEINVRDLDKIIHYSEILKASIREV
jgi:hypothetical protein